MINMYQPRYITGVISKYEEVENAYSFIVGWRYSAVRLQFLQIGRQQQQPAERVVSSNNGFGSTG